MVSSRSSSQTRWFLAKDKQRLGPFSWEQLQRLASIGKITSDDMLLEEGQRQWVSANTLVGLFSSQKETMAQSQNPVAPTLLTADGPHRSSMLHAPIITGYEILGKLGQGGMGVVYKARHLGLDRLVALKMLPAQGKDSEKALARFQREAKVLAKLQHPNIVQVHDIGEHEGQPYIALEMVNGGDLADYLSQRRPDVKKIAAFVEKLARAVHAAHEKGIIHRDLKPSNILLTEQGQPKITDFGIAKDLEQPSQQTATGAVLGTPTYMAPEQASGQINAIDARTDMYALGAILYEMLSGQPPFTGPAQIVIYHVLNSMPPSLRKLNRDVPKDLEQICLRCMSKKAHMRYESALKLAEALHEFRVPKTKEAPAPKVGQWWLLPTLIGGTALCIALLILLLTALAKDEPSTEPHIIRKVIKPKADNYVVELPDGVKLEMARVPKGTFWMSENDQNARNQFTIQDDFYIGKYEVTQEQWQAVMGSNPSYFSRSGEGSEKVKNISDADLKRFPVEQVSWEDCQTFITKLNEKNSKSEWTYRLPTEAEWEYTCRGGATSKEQCSFHFYLDKPTNDLSSTQANFDGNFPYGNAAKGLYIEQPKKVGFSGPNALGVYDMHGNVWEWCHDEWGSSRVNRGGSWNDLGEYCRAGYRFRDYPSRRYNILGFRLVQSSVKK